MNFFLEFIETPHVFCDDDGVALFKGIPDRKLVFPRDNITIIIDFKFGRNEVQSPVLNMQLRSYVCMRVMEPVDTPQQEHVPSSLLRRMLCPGSWALEAGIPEPDDTEDAAEGTYLHGFMADRTRDRSELKPEQLEALQAAERMESDFLDRAPSFKPGCTYAMIIQPRVRMKQYVAEYAPEDIQQAHAEILALWKSFFRNHQATRVASAEACQFCKGKPVCPEYKSWAFAVERFKGHPMGQWTTEQWNIFLERRGELIKFLEEGYDYAKRLKGLDPEALPGWELKEGNEVRHVEDVVGAYQMLSEKGLTTGKEFSECCEFSVSAAEALIWHKFQNTPNQLTHKQVRELFNRTLETIIQKRRNKPSLCKTK